MNILKLAWKSGVQPHKLFPKEFYREILLKEGHVMIKNTGIKSKEDLENWKFLVFDKHELEYEGEGEETKVSLIYPVVDTGSEPPGHINLESHNENAYHNKMPSRIAFVGLIPAKIEGITPITPTRPILENMPGRLMQRLKEEGQILVSNYFSEPQKEKEKFPFASWQSVFNVNSKEEFEEKLKGQKGFLWKWGFNDRLSLLRKTSAFITHPITGEECWTNFVPDLGHHWFKDWHPWNTLDVEERPFHMLWGNGERCSKEDTQELTSLVNRNLIREPFELGDIILVDNLLTMHGRSSFEGERLTKVMNGDPIFKENNFDMTNISVLENWKYLRSQS